MRFSLASLALGVSAVTALVPATTVVNNLNSLANSANALVPTVKNIGGGNVAGILSGAGPAYGVVTGLTGVVGGAGSLASTLDNTAAGKYNNKDATAISKAIENLADSHNNVLVAIVNQADVIRAVPLLGPIVGPLIATALQILVSILNPILNNLTGTLQGTSLKTAQAAIAPLSGNFDAVIQHLGGSMLGGILGSATTTTGGLGNLSGLLKPLSGGGLSTITGLLGGLSSAGGSAASNVPGLSGLLSGLGGVKNGGLLSGLGLGL